MQTLLIFPKSFSGNLYFNLNFPYSESIKIMCYNSIGKLIFVTTKPASDFVILQTELQSLKQGLYIFKCLLKQSILGSESCKTVNLK